MLKICGTIIKDNKIIYDEIIRLDIETTYDETLKKAISDLCNIFDIEEPYWLSINISEYAKRKKTTFNKDNFIDSICFDKFIIEDLKST